MTSDIGQGNEKKKSNSYFSIDKSAGFEDMTSRRDLGQLLCRFEKTGYRQPRGTREQREDSLVYSFMLAFSPYDQNRSRHAWW